MGNEIAYTVSAKAQLRVLVSWWLMATKALRLKVRGCLKSKDSFIFYLENIIKTRKKQDKRFV
ncbi:hypothetical protein C0T31_11965 [Dysgonamonadaceae bacterium]|nr:hypothetical protein C0T31_11965 [Dysgonamonadaceae bacterium]